MEYEREINNVETFYLPLVSNDSIMETKTIKLKLERKLSPIMVLLSVLVFTPFFPFFLVELFDTSFVKVKNSLAGPKNKNSIREDFGNCDCSRSEYIR